MDRPMREKRRGLGHFLTEALVITAGILLAFALDAWWDQRQERANEQELLTALSAEFVGVDAELVRAHFILLADLYIPVNRLELAFMPVRAAVEI